MAQWYTVANYHRFLKVLEYFPIDKKFLPTIIPWTLYTVKKKIY